MKKYYLFIILFLILLTLTGCNNQSIKELDKNVGETISQDVIDNISKTKKIIIKKHSEINKIIGTINDDDTINEIISIIKSSKTNGDVFNCDMYNFEFLMYDDNDKLIDTIYIWSNNERLIPKSIHSGCSYYNVDYNNNFLKKIIEDNSDYIFYT